MLHLLVGVVHRRNLDIRCVPIHDHPYPTNVGPFFPNLLHTLIVFHAFVLQLFALWLDLLACWECRGLCSCQDHRRKFFCVNAGFYLFHFAKLARH